MSLKYAELSRTAYRSFFELAGDIQLIEIREKDGTDWVSHMQKRTSRYGGLMKPNSINDYLRALKAGFERALKERHLTVNPFREIKHLPVWKKPPVIMSKEDFTSLRTIATENWFRDGIDLLSLTGFRRNELLGVQWEDIDFEQSRVYLSRRGELGPKGSRERWRKVSPEVIAMFSRLRVQADLLENKPERVLFDEIGTPISPDRLTKKFTAYARALGLDPAITLHSLRRGFATRLKDNNIGTHTVQGLMGHSSAKTTERYIGMSPEEEEKAMADLKLSNFVKSSPPDSPRKHSYEGGMLPSEVGRSSINEGIDLQSGTPRRIAQRRMTRKSSAREQRADPPVEAPVERVLKRNLLSDDFR